MLFHLLHQSHVLASCAATWQGTIDRSYRTLGTCSHVQSAHGASVESADDQSLSYCFNELSVFPFTQRYTFY